MRPFGRFALFAGLLALALAAAVFSPPAEASTAVLSLVLEQAPEHSPCLESDRHCETDAVAATAHPQPLDLGAAARARFAATPVRIGARRVAPHGPTSLSILFRNLRE
jgi:hypothetical protein